MLIAVAIAILLHTQLSDSGILQFLKNCYEYHQVIQLPLNQLSIKRC